MNLPDRLNLPDRRRAAAAEDLARTGLQDAQVELVAYDRSWPAKFAAEHERLTPLLEPAQLHHIGSTAVPGMEAKPVIDMMALVEDLDAPIEALLGTAAYQYPQAFNATLSKRRFLCYPNAAHRSHHLHLVGDPEELDRHLSFREMLRSDPSLAGEYVALKRALAKRHRSDREAYTEGKSQFIRDSLAGGPH